MSATYTAGANTLKKIEGGFCPGGWSCGSAESGRTYRGIDEGKQPGWKGWPMINAYIRKYGAPKTYSYFVGNDGRAIDMEVEKFWSAWWNGWGFSLLKNQYMAELLYTWSAQGPNRAIRNINEIGKKYGAQIFSSSKITPDVANAINNNLAKAYQDARNTIIAWYKENRKNDYQKFIDSRVNIFPVFIGNVTSTPGTPIKPPAPSTTTSSNSFLGWLAGLFSLASIYR